MKQMAISIKIHSRILEMMNIKEAKSSDKLKDNIGMDSLDLVELHMWAEEEFDIDIPDSKGEILEMGTLGEYINFVRKEESK